MLMGPRHLLAQELTPEAWCRETAGLCPPMCPVTCPLVVVQSKPCSLQEKAPALTPLLLLL
jgi:hypothetical protein